MLWSFPSCEADPDPGPKLVNRCAPWKWFSMRSTWLPNLLSCGRFWRIWSENPLNLIHSSGNLTKMASLFNIRIIVIVIITMDVLSSFLSSSLLRVRFYRTKWQANSLSFFVLIWKTTLNKLNGVFMNLVINIFNTSWTSFPFLLVVGWQKKGLSTFQAFVAVPLLPLAGGGKAFFLLAGDGENGWAFFFLLAGGGEAGSHWLAWRDAPCLQNCIVTCRVENKHQFRKCEGILRRLLSPTLSAAIFNSLGAGKAKEKRRGKHTRRESDREQEPEYGFIAI